MTQPSHSERVEAVERVLREQGVIFSSRLPISRRTAMRYHHELAEAVVTELEVVELKQELRG